MKEFDAWESPLHHIVNFCMHRKIPFLMYVTTFTTFRMLCDHTYHINKIAARLGYSSLCTALSPEGSALNEVSICVAT